MILVPLHFPKKHDIPSRNMLLHSLHVHFRLGRCRVTHSNYSSTTSIDYTLWTVQLQRQLTFQITFALYGLNDALSYSRRKWRFAKFTTQILQITSIFLFRTLQIFISSRFVSFRKLQQAVPQITISL